MENRIWSKTLLSLYRYLELISKTIEEIVKKEAHSAYNRHTTYATFDTANRIIELTEKKVRIINLKILIENMVAKLNDGERKIITLYMLENTKCNVVCDMLGISLRTFFRKKKTAIDKLGNILLNMGYNHERLVLEYGQEKWLMNAYDCYKNESNDEDDVCSYSDSRLGNIMSEIKNASFAYSSR